MGNINIIVLIHHELVIKMKARIHPYHIFLIPSYMRSLKGKNKSITGAIYNRACKGNIRAGTIPYFDKNT